VLTAIDRWAWAHQRPNKPGHVDEDDWLDTVRREIADVDPALVTGDRPPVPVTPRAIAYVDRDDLAARAVHDADSRASGNGGRFSDFDLRAGAVRAVAAAGVVAERSALDELIEDVTARAADTSTVTLLDGPDIPGHVKHRMATYTAAAKIALADKYDRLAGPGESVDADAVTAVASKTLHRGRSLDAGQTHAAGAIAGTDRLVTVTGPAGTGKTTMLIVARELLHRQGRRMLIVAPTKKAASVAGRETKADASSLHALLHDHGFRWTDTPAGQHWTRLVPGQVDPATGQTYDGPVKHHLTAGDRIVVDEAGMVDLHTANALADVAADTGAGIAMVGDHLQALPVGHSGAMSLMRTRSSASVELSAVHRFRTPDGQPDTEWAELTLRVRDPDGHAEDVARMLVDSGHVVPVATDADAREHMVTAWLAGHSAGHRVALVTATHEEAQAINDAIQQRRITAGQLDTDAAAVLQGGQVAYAGDIIQTRRNDAGADVENRQTWTVKAVAGGRITLTAVEDAGVSRTVDADYLSSHAHLSYATTVHGVQGETTARAIVGPGVDAAGLYVGLTRGREWNEAVVIADTGRAARTGLVETMQRGHIEATLDDAGAAARADLAHAARRLNVPVRSDGRPAPWHDRKMRPLGNMVHLDDVLSDAVERESALHEQITRLGDAITRDQDALAEVDAKIAAWSARDHAADLGGGHLEPAPLLLPTKDALVKRLTSARAERGELSREYRQITRRITAAQREQEIRAQLGPDVTAYEDDARRRAVRARFAAEVPAWDDRKRRPLGKLTTLRAKRVATLNELSELAAERDERAGRIAAAREMLRTGAGSDGVTLTPSQRERVSALLERATSAYDEIVDRHAKLSRLLQVIDREQGFRDQLATGSAERDSRISALRLALEVGVDADNETLSPQDREALSTELQQLVDQPDRAADRARSTARRPAEDSSPMAGPVSAEQGPSLV
jgi:hypothetical protein